MTTRILSLFRPGALLSGATNSRTKRRHNLLLTILRSGSLAATAQSGSIVGTWALTEADQLLPNGTRVADFGPSPHGLAIFTADGHYTVEIFTADHANRDMSVHFGRHRMDSWGRRLLR